MSEFFYLNSPLVKLYFFKNTAMIIYTPPNYLSILFLQFSYSRVIQFWSNFSVFFYLNFLLKILLCIFISVLVFDFFIVQLGALGSTEISTCAHMYWFQYIQWIQWQICIKLSPKTWFDECVFQFQSNFDQSWRWTRRKHFIRPYLSHWALSQSVDIRWWKNMC